MTELTSNQLNEAIAVVEKTKILDDFPFALEKLHDKAIALREEERLDKILFDNIGQAMYSATFASHEPWEELVDNEKREYIDMASAAVKYLRDKGWAQQSKTHITLLNPRVTFETEATFNATGLNEAAHGLLFNEYGEIKDDD